MDESQLPEHERIVKEIQDRIERYRADMKAFPRESSRYDAARSGCYALLFLLEDLGYSL
jgi:hypothetical protein